MRPLILIIIMIYFLTLLSDVTNLVDYQGRITDDLGVPVNGPVSITFAIYSESVGGTALWLETQNPVYVSNGLFHVFLGAVNPIPEVLFNDPERWIGIEVNSDGEMSPRARIGSVVYSQTDGDWTKDGDNVYKQSGNVGIGTENPTNKLEVVGNIEAEGFSVNGTPVGTSSDSYWLESNGNIYYNSGNIGIGTDEPGTKLDVNGTVAFRRGFINLDGYTNYTLTPVKSVYHLVADEGGTTISLADGYSGQILIIQVAMGNILTLPNLNNVRLNGDWIAGSNDLIMLVWTHAWSEISRLEY